MKCSCFKTSEEFIFCVEDADIELEKNIVAAWYSKVDDKPVPFLLGY